MTDRIDTPHSVIEDLAASISIQPESIVSRTFCKSERFKAVLFAFDVEQSLSEHTSSKEAIIQILQGEAVITLDDESHELSEGSWLHMPPHMRHSVYAKTPLIMLLLMFGGE